MIGHAVIYGIAFTCNCVLVSGSILSPLKVDPSSLHLYKSGPRSNDFEYILKRSSQDAQESPDSKERRSQMGSSFIRFGRNGFAGNMENADYSMTSGSELDSVAGPGASASRIARGRSDVIIRFGRSDLKNLQGIQGQTRGELKFLRYGNKPLESLQASDLDQLTVMCSDLLASSDANGNEVRLYLTKLIRLCNSLGLENDDNDESRRKSKIIEILEDASQTDSMKHE